MLAAKQLCFMLSFVSPILWCFFLGVWQMIYFLPRNLEILLTLIHSNKMIEVKQELQKVFDQIMFTNAFLPDHTF
jgi:hypothetical protein